MRAEILDFIHEFKRLNGFAPNQSQIAKGLHTSRQRVNYHFKDMAGSLKKYPEYKRFFV